MWWSNPEAVALICDACQAGLSATISFISPQAEFTPKQIQTAEERVKLVYRIKVDVNNATHELKNNMPVDAEIVL